MRERSIGALHCDSVRSRTDGDHVDGYTYKYWTWLIATVVSANAALITAFAVVTLLLLLFGGGLAISTMMSGGLMGVGRMGGVSGMWLPTLLLVALSAVL